MELCSWCQTKIATRWTFWTQRPDGSGQRYLYCMCDECHAKQSRPMYPWKAEHEVTRDEWLIFKTMSE